MISEKAKKWIEAGKLIAINPKASVACPECGLSILKAKDNTNVHNPQEIERMIYCPECNAKNFIKLHKNKP